MKTLITLSVLALALPLLAEEHENTNNGRKTEKDRQEKALTPLDQSNAPDDIRVTQAIRKALVKEETLSSSAKNVKIITANGKITLRGAVKDQMEKNHIEKVAHENAEGNQVDNQLEIQKPN